MPLLVLILVCLGTSTQAQDYTYLFTVASLDQEEQKFNVEIKSILDVAPTDTTYHQLVDQVTPLELTLGAGRHEIIVLKGSKVGRIESRLTGISKDEKRMSVTCDDHRAKLVAGPPGRVSTTRL